MSVLVHKALGLNSPIPKSARRVGIPLILLGLLLGGLAARNQIKAGDNPNPSYPVKEIVKSGPYRFTRNPIYLGMVLVSAGFAVLMNAAWSLLLLPPMMIALDRGAIRKEEAYLEENFGEEYREYKQRVPRWL